MENTYPSITNFTLDKDTAYNRHRISVINFFKKVVDSLIDLGAPITTREYPINFNERVKNEGQVLGFDLFSDWISEGNKTSLVAYFYVDQEGKIEINFSTTGHGLEPKIKTWSGVLEKDYPNLWSVTGKYVSTELFVTLALEELVKFMKDMVAHKKELLEKFHW